MNEGETCPKRIRRRVKVKLMDPKVKLLSPYVVYRRSLHILEVARFVVCFEVICCLVEVVMPK